MNGKGRLYKISYTSSWFVEFGGLCVVPRTLSPRYIKYCGACQRCGLYCLDSEIFGIAIFLKFTSIWCCEMEVSNTPWVGNRVCNALICRWEQTVCRFKILEAMLILWIVNLYYFVVNWLLFGSRVHIKCRWYSFL